MKKYIVTTTINPPTKALKLYSELEEWKLIVVGDLKTPSGFSSLDCIYISPKKQEESFPKLSELIGWNCIQRRNIGFLFALELGADIIATVDDDNVPLDNWGKNIVVGQEILIDNYEANRFNVFDPISVTEYPHLWHRGYPLQLLRERSFKKLQKKFNVPDIQANFWNGDPDIDAICRMEHSPNCEFSPSQFPFMSDGVSPFNSQNTFLTREALQHYFMFPFVGRMDDIWASFYLQALGYKVVYCEASVVQERNLHNLSLDFENEIVGYLNNLQLLESIRNDPGSIRRFIPERSAGAFDLYLDLTRQYSN